MGGGVGVMFVRFGVGVGVWGVMFVTGSSRGKGAREQQRPHVCVCGGIVDPSGGAGGGYTCVACLFVEVGL